MPFRTLGRILAAQALSSLGTSLSTIALAFMVYRLTGSVLHMGAIMAVSTLPLALTTFLGGSLLDRYTARSIMVAADVARASLIFFLPSLAQYAVYLIYVVAGLMGVLSALFNPAQIKVVADLTPSTYLIRANSYLSVCRDGAEMMGYLLGGVLVAYVGYATTFVIDSATYVCSAVLLLGLARVCPTSRTKKPLSGLIADTPSVLADIWRRPVLKVNLLLALFATAAVMMTAPNSYGLAMQVFARGGPGLAALEVSANAGLILGGLAISRFSSRGDKNAAVALAVLAMSGCFAGVGLSPWFWLSAALLGLAGVANVWMFVPSITMFQEVPDDARKGRIIAIRSGFGQIGSTIGLFLGGILGAELGVRQLFFVAGIAGALLALVIYLPHRALTIRRQRRIFLEATGSGIKRVAARALAEEAALSNNLPVLDSPLQPADPDVSRVHLGLDLAVGPPGRPPSTLSHAMRGTEEADRVDP